MEKLKLEIRDRIKDLDKENSSMLAGEKAIAMNNIAISNYYLALSKLI